jgi:thiol-disulfide isomerase/thioredoxin
MTSRALCLLALGLAIPMQGLHVALKRQIKPEDLAKVSSFATRPTQWQGRIAPDFNLPGLDGGSFQLSEHVGKEVVVLNFFATWCGPCREEMPELARFHAQNAARPVRLVAIDAEEKREVVAAYVEREEVQLQIVLDEPGGVVKAYGAESLPTTVVIGVDGRIQLYQSGAIRNTDVTLEPLVAANLDRLGRGDVVGRDAYLAAVRSETYAPPNGGSVGAGLSGRSLEIAQKLDCPCGCSDKVAKCGCKTAKNIKARLGSMKLEERTDADIARELDREFCMGGM